MRKTASTLLLVLSCAAVVAGCAIGHGPVTAAIMVEERGPVSAGPAAGHSKVGRSEAHGILFYATGDASISAAMKNGGITRIHHVDHVTSSYFGVYATYETIVYGE